MGFPVSPHRPAHAPPGVFSGSLPQDVLPRRLDGRTDPPRCSARTRPESPAWQSALAQHEARGGGCNVAPSGGLLCHSAGRSRRWCVRVMPGWANGQRHAATVPVICSRRARRLSPGARLPAGPGQGCSARRIRGSQHKLHDSAGRRLLAAHRLCGFQLDTRRACRRLSGDAGEHHTLANTVLTGTLRRHVCSGRCSG